jgi:hypothetical protein
VCGHAANALGAMLGNQTTLPQKYADALNPVIAANWQ